MKIEVDKYYNASGNLVNQTQGYFVDGWLIQHGYSIEYNKDGKIIEVFHQYDGRELGLDYKINRYTLDLVWCNFYLI